MPTLEQAPCHSDARSYFHWYSNSLEDEMATMAGAGGLPKYIFSMHSPPASDGKICVFNFIRIACAA
jgi:hypothetical protein